MYVLNWQEEKNHLEMRLENKQQIVLKKTVSMPIEIAKRNCQCFMESWKEIGCNQTNSGKKKTFKRAALFFLLDC